MAKTPRALALGLFAGVLGTVAVIKGWSFEESLGLPWLFSARGALPPPADVVLVDVDTESQAELGQPYNLNQWHRGLHGCLVERLAAQGASVVVFDLSLEPQSEPEESHERSRAPPECPAPDRAGMEDTLADAIAGARNVVLVQRLEVPERGQGDARESSIVLTQPDPAYVAGAAGVGPFPLPKRLDELNQFWAFRRVEERIVPTLPVVALAVSALRARDSEPRASAAETLLQNGYGGPVPSGMSARELDDFMQRLRARLRAAPSSSTREPKGGLGLPPAPAGDASRVVAGLLQTFAKEPVRYLNYYGPPGTVPHVRYVDVLRGHVDAEAISGKAVFVGPLDLTVVEQRDSFHTVFSENGIDISGAELAATAYANLSNRHTVNPPSLATIAAISLAFGVLAGFLIYLLPGTWAVVSAAAAGFVYFFIALALFDQATVWIPVFTPLVIQLPGTLVLGLLLQYVLARRQRANVSRAMEYYVPHKLAESFAQDGTPTTAPERVYGTCMATDVAGYTSVAERMDPQALSTLTNDYFEILGAQIAANGGQLLDIVGDGTTSVWAASQPEREVRLNACLAAIEVAREVDAFNRGRAAEPLPTRIGLHTGWVMMGNVGGGGHLTYGLVGDIANTASRIEGLNKVLHTTALASSPTVADLHDTLLVRQVGSFILKGKTEVLEVYELVNATEDAHPAQRKLCAEFAPAMDAFLAKDWALAATQFEKLLTEFPFDGPSRFYASLAGEYRDTPPLGRDLPAVRVETK